MKLYYSSPVPARLADHIALQWTGQPYETARFSREDATKTPGVPRDQPGRRGAGAAWTATGC